MKTYKRIIAAALVAATFVQLAVAAPTGTVSSGAPSLSRGAPKASDIADGDSAVSGRTGDMSYGYPIQVPPGRNGMAPKLSLDYSSNASIYGGIAAGWSLSIPQILEDTSEGRLPLTYAAPGSESTPYISTMAGRRRLMPVTETADADVVQTYRAEYDDSFMRYERVTGTASGALWRVRATSGTVMYFGEAPRMTGACASQRGYGFAPLTNVVDLFGNETSYEWGDGAHAGECVIKKITWGQNAALEVATFAQVVFNWSPSEVCNGIPVGSHTSERTGREIMTGASQLSSIVATAFPPGSPSTPEHTRRITLTYDASNAKCQSFTHAPVRYLSSIQESAWGTNMPQVDLPAVSFKYGSASVAPTITAQAGIPSLAWGKRYRDTQDDRWPTVESMLVDIDGDGQLDELVNRSQPSVDGQCVAGWYKSRGGPMRPITLPRLKWNGNRGISTVPEGSSTAADPTSGYRETCALNAQATVFRNSKNTQPCHKPYPGGSFCGTGPDPQNPGPYCTADNEGTECPVNTPVAKTSGTQNDYVTYLVYRWFDADGDGLVDLVTSVVGNINAYDIVQGNLPGFPAEPDLFGPWPACPTDMQPALDNPPIQYRSPYQRCYGLYPWIIYRGAGDGHFYGIDVRGYPTIKYSPIPLDPDTGDSTVRGPNTSDTNRTLMDFDGDGIQDAIQVSTRGTWYVWLGDGTGGFHGRRYSFGSRPGSTISTSLMDADGVFRATSGLFDIHSDGLPEHWIRMDPQVNRYANLAINTSLWFQVPGGTGTINTPTDVRPASDRTDWISELYPFQVGVSKATNRTLDVDVDGRVDVVTLSHSGSGADQTGALVFYNLGGQFQPAAGFYAGDVRGVANQNEGKDDTTWTLNTDLVDLDGDGIPESVSPLQISRHDLSGGPPRLMTAIDNGRGAQTSITYASMHDTAAVEQHPELFWFDSRPKASPRTQWVVKQTRVHDNFAAQDTTTTYHYKNPRFGADNRNRYDFRGFEEVAITGPSGAQTIETYGYDVDFSGRLVKSVVKADGQVNSITTTRWEPRTLFGNTTIHAIESEALICANGQDETTCTADTAPGYTKNITQMQLVGPTSTNSRMLPVLWAATMTTVQSASAPSQDDRRTTTWLHLESDKTKYHLVTTGTLREALDAGAWKVVGRTQQTYDSAYLTKLTDEVWFDDNDDNRAITTYIYQPDGSGNLLYRIKPNQSASTAHASYGYDSRKLFVTAEINERGQRMDYVYEYGTGTRVQTDGPNARTCTTTCPRMSSTYPEKERSLTKLDGLGRSIEQWDSYSTDASIYTLYQVSTTSYVDAATATTPASVTSRVRLDDSATSSWTEHTTELDGHGRTFRTTIRATGIPDDVTTYAYAANGTLTSVTAPDPSTSGATVTYTYTYDSLGRPRTMRRPDNTTATSQSGVNIDYDGVTETTTTVVGAAGGQASSTKVVRDRQSRVVRIDELRTAPSTWASTTYTYAPDGNVATVVGPQGVTTSFAHDYTGNRTRITRHGRTWTFVYDKNGNVISETAPGGTAATQALYTTTVAYDDLDRPTSKAVAPRGLSAADQTLFGVGTETYTWDTGPNGIGSLRSWSSGPTLTSAFEHDAQGNAWSTTHTLQVAGFPQLTRSTNTFVNLAGTPRSVRYRDMVGATTNETVVDYNYDTRGLPSSLRLSRTGEPTILVAEETRGAGGYVTKRRNNTGSGTFVEANFTYDKLGRIKTQDVLRSQTPTRVVRQDLSYFGDDNPRSLTHYLGATSKAFNFAYDLRGQLRTVSSTTSGYFSGTYSYGAGGRFSRATETQSISPLPPGRDVRPRSVDYIYGDADPERVTQLRNVSDSTTYAGYAYDASGNMTRRCYGGSASGTCAGESLDFVYDGKDQLRRVTRKLNGVVQGSEEYWYGPGGGRVAIVKRNASGAKTELVFFVGDVEAHYDATGAATKAYSYLSLGTPVARVERTSTGTSLEYEFHGLADSTIATVAANGNVNAAFSYAPFGELLETTDGGGTTGVAAHRRRFNDKYQDEVSSLSYYGARYYDKTLIGWTQADPVYVRVPETAGNPRRGNVYQFVLNNPLSYVDPDGLRDQKLGTSEMLPGLGYEPPTDVFGGFGLPDWATGRYWDPMSVFHWSKSDPINRSIECSEPGPCGDPVGEYVSEWLTTITETKVKTKAASAMKTVDMGSPKFAGYRDWTLCNPLRADCEVDWWGAYELYQVARSNDPVQWFIYVYFGGLGEPNKGEHEDMRKFDPWLTDTSPSIETSSISLSPPPGPLPMPGKGRGTVPKALRDRTRGFSKKLKRVGLFVWDGTCAAGCGKVLTLAETIGHHIKRWADGGLTNLSNLAPVCKDCHIKKLHKRAMLLNALRRHHGLAPRPAAPRRGRDFPDDAHARDDRWLN